MGKRVRLTDDSLNSHGTRVITEGCDMVQCERNPVLLYMHERGKVIGFMKELRKENGEITGEPVFDCATDLSRQCKKQWEVGSLRMVSIGIDILELSEDAELLVTGQTSPTITRSKIFEVSIVDIGANDNAISMRRYGKQITLGHDSPNPLPRLKNNQPQPPKIMDQKELALKLGLAETADESAITAKIDELTAAAAELETLRQERERLTLAQVTDAVDTAIAENRITADKKEHFVALGKQLGIESLKTTLAAIPAAARLSKTITPSSAPQSQRAAYTKLSEVPADEIEALKRDNEAEYRRLFRAEYGYDY